MEDATAIAPSATDEIKSVLNIIDEFVGDLDSFMESNHPTFQFQQICMCKAFRFSNIKSNADVSGNLTRLSRLFTIRYSR